MYPLTTFNIGLAINIQINLSTNTMSPAIVVKVYYGKTQADGIQNGRQTSRLACFQVSKNECEFVSEKNLLPRTEKSQEFNQRIQQLINTSASSAIGR